MAAAVQERNAQPPDGNRAVRRRGDLYGRRDPRSALGQMRTSMRRCASPERGDPLTAGCRDAARQAATAKARHDSRGRIQLLRQSDRAGDRTSVDEIYHRGLCCQAYGNRRGHRGGSARRTWRRERTVPQETRSSCSGGKNRQRRLRRRDRLVQIAHARLAGMLRRGGAEGQRAGRAKIAAPVPQPARLPRLIKRCNDFGAGGVSVAIGELADGLEDRTRPRPQEIRGAGRNRTRHFGVAGAHGCGRGEGRRGSALSRSLPRRTWNPPSSRRCSEAPRLTMYWKRQDASCDHLPRVLEFSNGARKYTSPSAPAKAASLCKKRFGRLCGQPACALARSQRLLRSAACPSALTPPSARARVLMPFGGKYQRTPAQAMVNKISVRKGAHAGLLVYGVGLQPLYYREKPLSRGVSRRGRVRVQG